MAMGELADRVAAAQLTPELDDKELIRLAQERGFIVHKDEPNIDRHIALDAPTTGTVKFAVVSDTHLGHKHQQLTHWRAFNEQARDFGAEFMLHAGDMVDGGRMHRDQEFELFKHGADAQGKYAIESVPELRNKRGKVLPQYVIGGNHDGSFWNDAGANVLGLVADRRSDIEFLGAPTATFHVSGLDVMLMHPDGGVPYARSYRLQKIVEQLPADHKPHILLLGHWHVTCHLPGYRNVEAFSLPCFQAQTAYMRRKGLAPVIGGLMVEAEYSDRGLEKLTTHWVLYRNELEADWP